MHSVWIESILFRSIPALPLKLWWDTLRAPRHDVIVLSRPTGRPLATSRDHAEVYDSIALANTAHSGRKCRSLLRAVRLREPSRWFGSEGADPRLQRVRGVCKRSVRVRQPALAGSRFTADDAKDVRRRRGGPGVSAVADLGYGACCGFDGSNEEYGARVVFV